MTIIFVKSLGQQAHVRFMESELTNHKYFLVNYQHTCNHFYKLSSSFNAYFPAWYSKKANNNYAHLPKYYNL